MSDFEPSARILADSISPDGHRLTTMEVRFHRFVLAEFNTHRAFCLAGDSLLEFDLPAGSPRSKHRAYRMRLDEFVDKWHNGARRIGANPKRPSDLSWIDPAREYSANEIAGKLGMTSTTNINTMCRRGTLPARKDGRVWMVSGQAVLDWRSLVPEHTRFDIRARLGAMAIRQMDELSKQITTACVVGATYSGDKEVFEVRLANGMHVAGSADHQVLTADGWKVIGQLTGEDLVYVRRQGTPEDERRDADRLRKINGRWRSVWQRQTAASLRAADPMCRICRSAPGVDVHHWTPVHIAPELAFDVGNVTYLCKPCHTDQHRVQGWQGGTYLYGALSAVASVTSRGIEPTYDLAISGPYPNFLANGVVVHNSRNAASSRAVPVHRMFVTVADEPAIPITWPAEQKGMQGGEEISVFKRADARSIWLAARDSAVDHAERLVQLGVHKSIANRLLEPFLPITVIVSATDWHGFWRQRVSPLAQPEIAAVASLMREAHSMSQPEPISYGDWHLPYITSDDEHAQFSINDLCAISAARCARVSYLTHDGRRDTTADINLYNRLIHADPPHASPLEHVATPNPRPTLSPGNFTGWLQLRHTVLGT